MISTTPLKAASRETRTERALSVLFIVLLGYLVLYPYGQNAGLPFLAFRVFGTAVTCLSIYAISFRRVFVLVGLLLSAPALVERILLNPGHPTAISVVSISFGFAFDVFIVAVLFRRVFMTEEPTKELIFGALCIYLLAGFGFARVYSMLANFQSHGFYLDPAVNIHSVPDRFDLIYYSFATMTCLGPSGIVPVSTQVRSISVIEALFGVLYLAVLIARLLNTYQMQTVRDRA